MILVILAAAVVVVVAVLGIRSRGLRADEPCRCGHASRRHVVARDAFAEPACLDCECDGHKPAPRPAVGARITVDVRRSSKPADAAAEEGAA